MKTTNFYALLLILVFGVNGIATLANEPDSAYIYGYAVKPERGRNGLQFAWSIDKKSWKAIGPDHVFMNSDYGSWGGQKKMYSPYLFQDGTGRWHCVWSVNNEHSTFAYATSMDLVNWKPQDYPATVDGLNCLNPEIYAENNKSFTITWVSLDDNDSIYYSLTTEDFRTFSAPQQIFPSDRFNARVAIDISSKEVSGTVHKVAWEVIDKLINAQKIVAYNAQLTNENYRDDERKFKNLEPINVSIKANVERNKNISDLLMGVFFEDINYAADGGLYAELIENRGFEYNLHDKKGRDKSWTATKAWSLMDSGSVELNLDTLAPIHENNKHYALLDFKKEGAGLANSGFNGIAVKAGEKYDFSFFAQNKDDNVKEFIIRITGKDGQIAGEKTIKVKSAKWKKLRTVITSDLTIDNARLEMVSNSTGRVAIDMISLFPQNTFKGHNNGLRADLAQSIADMNPKFIRFPGGCVAHGDGIHNIYNWKNTIGPLETRLGQRNLWGYHQSFGLGYFEYFQLCEDIGAEPVPVVAAGVPCQNSSDGGAGQQGGIPLSEMDRYIQDILDLIEYCNGDKKSTWGKKRAEAGHPEPFNLKYLGIGNEDLISEVFKERFELIYKAINKKYPEIIVIGTVGPFYEGSDYVEGWKFASELEVPMVDEHYYQQPGWFINNQHFYDTYDRTESKVYLGEYASWNNEWYNALAEAIYLTGLERNGDVVAMASYAPLLAKERNTQWRTDLIFFNNTEVKPTPSYEVQKLYGQNAGDVYVKAEMNLSDNSMAVRNRIGSSIVKDSETGDIIIKLVNILPVETNVDVSISGLTGFKSVAQKTVVAGAPQLRTVTPQSSEVKIGDKIIETLAPYSFTVIRLTK